MTIEERAKVIAEERERCIKVVQNWLCKTCCENCYSHHDINACYKGKAVRKAIEVYKV